jgi:hypothetical protein
VGEIQCVKRRERPRLIRLSQRCLPGLGPFCGQAIGPRVMWPPTLATNSGNIDLSFAVREFASKVCGRTSVFPAARVGDSPPVSSAPRCLPVSRPAPAAAPRQSRRVDLRPLPLPGGLGSASSGSPSSSRGRFVSRSKLEIIHLARKTARVAKHLADSKSSFGSVSVRHYRLFHFLDALSLGPL